MNLKERYYKDLKNPKWIEFREIIIKRDKRCIVCGNKNKLHAHHKYYTYKYKLPWDYPISSLVTLCENCHNEIHKTFYFYDSDYEENKTLYNKNIKNFDLKTGDYEIGNFRFKTKSEITKYTRTLIDLYPINTKIFEDDIYLFVQELYRNHPNPRGLDFKPFIEIRRDEEHPNYSNFVVFFENGEHQFSNVKCIKKIKKK